MVRIGTVSFIVIALLLHNAFCGQNYLCNQANDIAMIGQVEASSRTNLVTGQPLSDTCICEKCSHDFILPATLTVLFSNPGVVTVPMPNLPLPGRPAPAERLHAQPGLPPAGYRQFDPTALILRC